MDPTEPARRALVTLINFQPGSREALEAEYGKVWDTTQLSQEFEVTGFMAPFVVVRRKSDSVVGSMTFQHMPRFYWGFEPDRG